MSFTPECYQAGTTWTASDGHILKGKIISADYWNGLPDYDKVMYLPYEKPPHCVSTYHPDLVILYNPAHANQGSAEVTEVAELSDEDPDDIGKKKGNNKTVKK